MAKKRNQHLIPRLWLKHFSINEQVYVYDTKKKKIFGPRNVESIGHRPYYYDFTEASLNIIENKFIKDYGLQFVEDFFLANKIEDNLAKVLQNIISKPWYLLNKNWLTTEEKASLSLHFSIQFYRTETFRKLIDKILIAINNYGQENNIKEYKHNMNEYKSLYQFHYMSDGEKLMNLAKGLYDKPWSIFFNCTGLPFFTSDNPVVLQKSKRYVNICVPISSKLLIVIYDNKLDALDQFVLHPTLAQVQEFNYLQLQQCGWQVFSPTNDYNWINDKHLAKTGFNQLLDSNASWIDSFVRDIIENQVKE